MAFSLTSTAFDDGAPIPSDYTCDASNRSPALRWSDVPAGTRSFALIMHDPDAPRGDFTHWVLFNLPAGLQELPEGAGAGQQAPGVSGVNDFSKVGYGGPCPPPGHGRHRYRFDLYALDLDRLALEPGATRAEVEAALRPHALGQAQVTGVYERQGKGAR
jgi:hypothetical protein